MKRLVLLVLLGLIMALGTSVNSHLFADEESETTEIDFEVEEIFEIAFYPRDGIDESDENIAYPDGEVEFDDIDPMELGDDGYPIAMVPSEERASSSNEDLSDVGILCVSNNGNGWKLGIHMEDTDLTKDNFVVYVPEFGYYRNIEGTKIPAGYSGTGGAVAKTWNRVPLNTPMRVFTGSGDYTNTVPWGTLLTFSFAVVPSGSLTLDDGTVVCSGPPMESGDQDITIVYTLSDDI